MGSKPQPSQGRKALEEPGNSRHGDGSGALLKAWAQAAAGRGCGTTEPQQLSQIRKEMTFQPEREQWGWWKVNDSCNYSHLNSQASKENQMTRPCSIFSPATSFIPHCWVMSMWCTRPCCHLSSSTYPGHSLYDLQQADGKAASAAWLAAESPARACPWGSQTHSASMWGWGDGAQHPQHRFGK